LQFGTGELGWKRRRRNRGGEGWHIGDILTFVNGKRTHFLNDFVGNSDGELATSLYRDPSLNSSVKSPAKTSTSSNHFFL
jgi:hypothetical protein